MIIRYLHTEIIKQLTDNHKVVVVFGARQVGKTTLIKQIIEKISLKTLHINADQTRYHEVLSSRDLNKMQSLIGDNELLFIDEAQNIPNIGINLKILHDEMPELKIIVSGSSSFELANRIKEPLTGRTVTFHLYPLALLELKNEMTEFELKDKIEEFLIFGTYPGVYTLNTTTKKIKHLVELISSYLYRDVLQLSNIKHSDKIYRLLKLLAYQIGSEVSIHELAKQLGMSHETVNSYIDLLEQGFIIHRLSAYSRNLRKEVSKRDKIYFTDTGIRNALINNFNTLTNRTDVGALWENFLFIERQKKMEYHAVHGQPFFWRLYSGAELDYIEERDGKLFGYEFKWGGRKKNPPKSWLDNYDSTFEIINKENYFDFII